MGTTGQCQVTASSKRAHSVSRVIPQTAARSCPSSRGQSITPARLWHTKGCGCASKALLLAACPSVPARRELCWDRQGQAGAVLWGSPGKGPAVTGDTVGGHLLTLAGPTAQPCLGTAAFGITRGRRGVPCCCEWPAQLPPYMGNPRHMCWWQQSLSLHAWSRMPSLQCLQEELCAPTASLTPQIRQTQPCSRNSVYPCSPPHSHVCGGMPGTGVGSVGQGEATGSGNGQEATG